MHLRSFALTQDGRNLEGLAYRYDHPSLVTDNGRDKYLEAFERTSATKTLKERSTRPLFRNHRRHEDPIGTAGFEPSAEGLMFRARLSKTVAADEALELVNDGALTDASIGFLAVASRRRAMTAGLVVVRTEIAIRELSLAPTGFGQHAGAGVLAVRSDDTDPTPALDRSRRRYALLLDPKVMI